MDGTRFDTLTRALAAISTRASRRASLRILGTGTLLPALSHLDAPQIEAKKKHKRHKKRKKKGDARQCPDSCTSDADCCDAQCCKLAGRLDGTCCPSVSPFCHHYFNGTAACFDYPE